MSPNWSGVDKVTLFSFGGTNAGLGGTGAFYSMDNLTGEWCTPSTLAVYGVGLVMLGLVGWRRKTLHPFAPDLRQAFALLGVSAWYGQLLNLVTGSPPTQARG